MPESLKEHFRLSFTQTYCSTKPIHNAIVYQNKASRAKGEWHCVEVSFIPMTIIVGIANVYRRVFLQISSVGPAEHVIFHSNPPSGLGLSGFERLDSLDWIK